jgi:hypothetical protein
MFRTDPRTQPLLRQEIKDARWLQPDPRTRIHRMIARRVRWALILTLILLLIDLFGTLDMIKVASGRAGYVSLNIPSQYIYFGAILVSFGLIIVGDFWYLFRGLRAISPHRESGHWDMIRLTPTPAKTLLGAKYVAVQLQSWRVLSAELLPRLYLIFACIPFFSLVSLQFAVSFGRYSYNRASIWDAEDLIIFLTMTSACVFFAMEAVWRMRAVTALGLALSARSRHTINGLLIGFFVMIGVHILQIGSVLLSYFVAQTVFREWYLYNWNGSFWGGMFMLVTSIVGSAGLNYLILRLVHLSALRYALRHAFRDV